jgi:single stranded DNA-binding protein
MRDIATATLSGNLTREVELHELPSGSEVARLRVASPGRRRSGEEWVDTTNYFAVDVYGAQARPCAQYLGKGSRVIVDAELDWREGTDDENHRKEVVTLRARRVLFECAHATAAAMTPTRAHHLTTPSRSRRPREVRARPAPTICRSEPTVAPPSARAFWLRRAGSASMRIEPARFFLAW